MKKRIAGVLTAALIGTTVMGTVVMANTIRSDRRNFP